MDADLTFTAELWRWTARKESADTGAWCFVTLPVDLADDVVGAVQPEVGGELDEVVGGGRGVADDHAADRLTDDVVDRGDDLLAGQLAVGEDLADPVAADAPLLDRDERAGVVLQHRRDGGRRVEGLLVDDLHRRVAEDDGAVGRHHPQLVGLLARDVEQVGDAGHAVRRAAAGQHDVRAGVERAVHGVVDLA